MQSRRRFMEMCAALCGWLFGAKASPVVTEPVAGQVSDTEYFESAPKDDFVPSDKNFTLMCWVELPRQLPEQQGSKWHHVTAFYGRNLDDIRVHIDGKEASTEDPAIFGRELTQKEWETLYNGGNGLTYPSVPQGETGLTKHLCSYYLMDGASGPPINKLAR